MKLQPRTVQILKNFATINAEILFKAGHSQVIMNPTKKVLARAAIQEEIPADFAIGDLSRFIGTLSLFQDPQLEVNEKFLTISEKGQKVNYTFADPDMITAAPKKVLAIPVADVEFTLNEAALIQLLKAAGVLGLPHITVTGNGENIFIGVDSCNDRGANKYFVEVGQTKREFRFAFELEYFRLLPGTYKVTLSKAGLGHFMMKDVEYWIATEEKYNHFN